MSDGLILAAAIAVLAASRRASAEESAKTQAGAAPALDRASLERLAVEIAAGQGASPQLVLAHVDIESNWDPNATNFAAGDGARGGAFGLGQMTYKTGLAVDDRIKTEWGQRDELRAPWLLLEPRLNLTLSSALVAENETRAARMFPRGSEDWLKSVASLYNSGRVDWRTAPDSTRLNYIPKFLRAYKRRTGVA
jgi:soluble lytic murein transglycosylase-like protein